MVGLAMIVLEFAPELADAVTDTKSLIEASEIAAQRKKQADADKRKMVKPNLATLAAGKILSYKTATLAASESSHKN